MKKISKATQSGGKVNEKGRLINEDRLTEFEVSNNGKNINFIILMDGASGLGKNNHIIPGYTSAEWYVDFMALELKKAFEEDPTKSIQDVVEECIGGAIKRIERFEEDTGIKLTEYEKPSASLAIQREDGENIELFLLGDTDTIVEYTNGEVIHINNPNQNAVRDNDMKALEKAKALADETGCDVKDMISSPEVTAILQENRAKKNIDCKGGYWILGTTLGATKHGEYLRMPKSEIKTILLATDGFNREIIGKDEKEILKLIEKIGIDGVMRAIIDAENNDPKLERNLRFKLHDDNTVVYKQVRLREHESPDVDIRNSDVGRE